MKNRIIYTITHIILPILGFILIVVMLLVCNVTAEESDIPEGFIPCAATAYCDHGTTATGAQTRYGICASSKDRFGAVLVLYQRLPDGSLGKCIGMYECLDTGGTPIRNGNVIDIWKPNLEECQEFMNTVYEDGCKGKVYVQVVYGEG